MNHPVLTNPNNQPHKTGRLPKSNTTHHITNTPPTSST